MTPAPMTILVVDDDATARVLMRAALVKAGFEVRLAGGGEEGLRAFREQPVHMVMLDVDMPDLDGHEVCVRLRAEAGEQLPIVMVTGMDDVKSVERAYDSGATDFIAKPIHWALLGHRVRYLLRASQAMLDLQTAEARNAAILNAIPDLLFELDIDGMYIDYHTPRSDLLAAPPEVFIGKTIDEVLPPDAAAVCHAALQAALEQGSSTGLQFELALPQGTRWFELSVSRKLMAAGHKPRFIVLSRDITERKEAENRIARLAYFDSLTGLPNRQSFLERLGREVQRARRSQRQLAVLFMDIDGFKTVNDSMGHFAGDQILQQAADRLTRVLRPSDLVSRVADAALKIELARLGGDEFTALIVDVERPEDVMAVADRIHAQMRAPFQVGGRDVLLTASIGIALFPEDGQDATALLEHADTAMYHAKEMGRDNGQFYRAALTEQARDRLELSTGLRLALERGEFHLVYQPQFDVKTRRVVAVEALIRWVHPERGLVPPLEFIPLAEQNGLIVPIGEWVLRTACADAARWQRAGHWLSVAVNVSPAQFKDPNLVQTVRDTLAQTGLAPQMLVLELTETALMADDGATLATLNALRDCGVQFALDDFGTGYSSLSYLRRMPLNNVKIDRSFVMGLPHDGGNLAIVRAILSMADSLGYSVTAEGVETDEQARALTDMRCDLLQGYFIGRPVAAAEIPAELRRIVDDHGAPAAPISADMEDRS
jgi:diguanylate cyclase (GGDEF)-like protein/PAS domain S-box-containing protein